MAQAKYPKPEYSRRDVNRAGETFLNPNATQQEKDEALVIINNWRTAHSFTVVSQYNKGIC